MFICYMQILTHTPHNCWQIGPVTLKKLNTRLVTPHWLLRMQLKEQVILVV